MFRGVDGYLSKIRTADTCMHSIIYRNIARECSLLSKSNARNRYLIIFSDFLEHSEISFYDSRTIEILKADPEAMQRRLEATEPMPDISGMNVWLIFSAGTYEENSRYMTVARFYRHLLESHGGTVHIETKFTLP